MAKFNIETKVPAREGVPKKDLNHNEQVYTEEWNQLVLDAKQLDKEVQGTETEVLPTLTGEESIWGWDAEGKRVKITLAALRTFFGTVDPPDEEEPPTGTPTIASSEVIAEDRVITEETLMN